MTQKNGQQDALRDKQRHGANGAHVPPAKNTTTQHKMVAALGKAALVHPPSTAIAR